MKIIAIVIFVVISFLGWLFAIRTNVNGKNDSTATYKIRTLSYWLAIILTMLIGLFIGNL